MELHSTSRKFLESEDEKFDPHLYRQLIGSLMQLSTWTILRLQDSESMTQVEEPSDAQDFVIICMNARPDINYSQLVHDELRTDPELSKKELVLVKCLIQITLEEQKSK